MVTLAEDGFKNREEDNQAWQEMLNHATNRVNEAEKDRNESAVEHRKKYKTFQEAEKAVTDLTKNLKRSIKKSKSYFELKAQFNQKLDDQKRQVQVIEETIAMTKRGYADSLKELEKISEEIHDKRVLRLGQRGQGVGAENPSSSESNSAAQTPSYEKLDEVESMERLNIPPTAEEVTEVTDSESSTSLEEVLLDDVAMDQLIRAATEELPTADVDATQHC